MKKVRLKITALWERYNGFYFSRCFFNLTSFSLIRWRLSGER